VWLYVPSAEGNVCQVNRRTERLEIREQRGICGQGVIYGAPENSLYLGALYSACIHTHVHTYIHTHTHKHTNIRYNYLLKDRMVHLPLRMFPLLRFCAAAFLISYEVEVKGQSVTQSALP
jgi:hypothetical protein